MLLNHQQIASKVRIMATQWTEHTFTFDSGASKTRYITTGPKDGPLLILMHGTPLPSPYFPLTLHKTNTPRLDRLRRNMETATARPRLSRLLRRCPRLPRLRRFHLHSRCRKLHNRTSQPRHARPTHPPRPPRGRLDRPRLGRAARLGLCGALPREGNRSSQSLRPLSHCRVWD